MPDRAVLQIVEVIFMYPCLVPKWACTTDIYVTIYSEGLNENGGPELIFEGELQCNYQDSAKTVMDKSRSIYSCPERLFFVAILRRLRRLSLEVPSQYLGRPDTSCRG